MAIDITELSSTELDRHTSSTQTENLGVDPRLLPVDATNMF